MQPLESFELGVVDAGWRSQVRVCFKDIPCHVIYNKRIYPPPMKKSISYSLLKIEDLVGEQGRQALGWGQSLVLVCDVY